MRAEWVEVVSPCVVEEEQFEGSHTNETDITGHVHT